jgi:hypothetical protein
MAESADDVEDRVSEPEQCHGRLDITVTSSQAAERLEEKSDEKRDQEENEPQTPAEWRYVRVPLQLQEVWLPDQQLVPVYVHRVSHEFSQSRLNANL